VFSRLKPEQFQDTDCRAVYRLAHHLYVRGNPITVADMLRVHEERGYPCPDQGLPLYIASMDPGTPPNPEIVSSWTKNVLESHWLERFKERAAGLHQYSDVTTLARDSFMWGDEASEVKSADEVAKEFLALQDKILKGGAQGMPWGLGGLDKYSRLGPGKMYVVAGIKKGGKTQFLVQMLDKYVTKGLPSLFFSLEMTREECVKRLCSRRTRIDSMRVLTENLSKHEVNQLRGAAEQLGEQPFWIDDTASLTTADIYARARAWKYKNNVLDGQGFIGVDYLQLIRMNQTGNRADAIKDTAYELARMAKDLKLPVVSLVQLRNEAEGQEPSLRYIEGSGGIAQAATAIILLDHVSRREKEAHASEMNIILDAQRDGRGGVRLPCTVDLSTSTFTSPDDVSENISDRAAKLKAQLEEL
jgi:replicative DNA helicase